MTVYEGLASHGRKVRRFSAVRHVPAPIERASLMTSNISSIDRFFRILVGALLVEAGYFWLAAPSSWLAYAVAAILIVTALLRFCPLYRMIGLGARLPVQGTSSPLRLGLAAMVIAGVAAGGAYGSIFFTRKLFLEDFNAMNHFYKQALFLTGQAKRDEAVSNFDLWKPAFERFRTKYSNYRPYPLKNDSGLEKDFDDVAAVMASAEPLVRTGDLHEAHLALEAVRPIFQGTFKRNGFSLLAVALVDFHDAMETILAAASAKDPDKVGNLYSAVSEKLKAVEGEANDPEIQAIRNALDGLLAAAKAGQADALPDLGSTLKTSFVKVYLQRG